MVFLTFFKYLFFIIYYTNKYCENFSQRYAYEGDSDWEVHRAFPASRVEMLNGGQRNDRKHIRWLSV